MPRPKGSKNRKTSVNTEMELTLENICERIAEVEENIEMLANELKSKKAELKELTKLKERAEAAVAAKKAEEDKEAILAAVAASGKTAEEIIEMIKR